MADSPRYSGSTVEKQALAWLEKHLVTRLEAQDELFCAKLTSMQRAVDVATGQLEHRLAGLNEYRAALGDLSTRMATRDEVGLQVQRIAADIADLKKSRDEASGKASQTQVLISLLIAVAGLVMGVISLMGSGG